MKIIIFIFLFFIPTTILADYFATGRFEGWHSSMMGMKTTLVNVDAVKKGGKFYNLQTQYPRVSEYKKSMKRCWINFKTSGTVLDMFRGRSFYARQRDGSFKKLNLSSLTFPCVKR